MDSGWNCTPCTGYSLCFIPIISSLSVHAVISKQSGSVERSTINEWYLVASNGFGKSLKTLDVSGYIEDVCPCL